MKEDSTISPLLSVLMLTYNHESFIKQALESILNQTINFSMELIISNDCSSDRTHDIIADTVSEITLNPNIQIKYFDHKQNMGMMGNSKWILQQARGKYIALCEGDDYWIDSDKLNKQMELFESSENCNLVVTNARYYYQEQNKFKKFHVPDKFIDTNGRLNPKFLFLQRGIIFSTASYLFKKELVDEKFYEIFDNLNVGDRAIQLRAIYDGYIYVHNEETSVYRVTTTGDSWNAQNHKKFNPEIIKSLNNELDLLSKILDYKYYNLFKYQLSINIASQIYRSGYAGSLLDQLKLAIKYRDKIFFRDWLYLIPRMIFK